MEVAPGFVLCPQCPGLQKYVEPGEERPGGDIPRSACDGVAQLLAEDARKGVRRRSGDRTGRPKQAPRARANWEPDTLPEVVGQRTEVVLPKARNVHILLSREMDAWVAQQASSRRMQQSAVVRGAILWTMRAGVELPTHTPRSTWTARRSTLVRVAEPTWQALRVAATDQGHAKVGRLVAIMVDYCARRRVDLRPDA